MKRIFVAFAMEDQTTKLMFTGQAKNSRVPYEFVDMSVKTPWDSAWKTNCRARIKGCDATIVLVSKNLKNAEGALWEVKCSLEEQKPIIGIYLNQGTLFDVPVSYLYKFKCFEWKYEHIKSFIESL